MTVEGNSARHLPPSFVHIVRGGFAGAVLLRRRYAVMKTRHAPAADESSYSGSTKTARNEDLQELSRVKTVT